MAGSDLPGGSTSSAPDQKDDKLVNNSPLCDLPLEILLQIVSYLDTKDIAALQRTCRALLQFGRDDTVWKDLCFQTSSLYRELCLSMPVTQNDGLPIPPDVHYDFRSTTHRHPSSLSFAAMSHALNLQPVPAVFHAHQMVTANPVQISLNTTGNVIQNAIAADLLAGLAITDDDDNDDGSADPSSSNQTPAMAQDTEQDQVPSLTDDEEEPKPVVIESYRAKRTRLLANWDPSYPKERVSWYEEYIHRTAPTVVSWFEQARSQEGHGPPAIVEARGAALYRPDTAHNDTCGPEALLAVAPLDDGSICLWDVNGTRVKKGSVLAKSKPGILFIDGPGADNKRASKRVDSGVTECVSVDNQRHRAFFAVQSHLIDVDLKNLVVVGCESFPWSITALSPAHGTVPLTIATSLGVHLYDYKEGRSAPPDYTERVDGFSTIGAKYYYDQNINNLFSNNPLPPYAALAQPGPLSILHLPKPGSEVDVSDDIFVAGRFSHILQYDRRRFPAIKSSISSGGSLCSMVGSPYPFTASDYEKRRKGELTTQQVADSKELHGGRTLIACGEYNQKGSLELYGLAPPSEARQTETCSFKNRFTASGSKLLSVVNHGTRIAVSDGQGYVKWFERDGLTEIRRCKIGHNEGNGQAAAPAMFASMPSADDLARKILPTREGSTHVNDNDLLFWTGEKLGLIGFGAEPSPEGQHYDPVAHRTAEHVVENFDSEEDRYRELMRLGLYQNARSESWFFNSA